jgi:hypothetical protein
VNRKTLLTAFLKQHQLQAAWIDREPNKRDLKKFYKYSEDEWKTKTLISSESDSTPPRKLKDSETSLLFKHYLALKKIVREKYPVTLLLEDDVLFSDNFSEIFNNNLKSTPDDWDYIFPGSGCQLRIPRLLLEKDKIAYLKTHPATKCTDSIIIKLDAAKKILKTFDSWQLPADWEYNHQLHHHDLNVYWWEPPVFVQGSQTGIYKSAIQ